MSKIEKRISIYLICRKDFPKKFREKPTGREHPVLQDKKFSFSFFAFLDTYGTTYPHEFRILIRIRVL
jgi:hypothetical protein